MPWLHMRACIFYCLVSSPPTLTNEIYGTCILLTIVTAIFQLEISIYTWSYLLNKHFIPLINFVHVIYILFVEIKLLYYKNTVLKKTNKHKQSYSCTHLTLWNAFSRRILVLILQKLIRPYVYLRICRKKSENKSHKRIIVSRGLMWLGDANNVLE